MKISIFGDTIVGKQRDHNEDSFIILCDINKQWKEVNDQQVSISDSRGLIFAVADGMGGTNAGEVASAIALSTVKEKIGTIPYNIKSPEQIHRIFNSIILSIHSNIQKEARKNKEAKGMGTTIVLGWILKSVLYITWIGDSRCYYYNKTTHSQLTPFSEDHSLVWSMVKSGEITPEEARLSSESNLLLQSLGDTNQVPMPDFKWVRLSVNDRILLCSDGLNSMLSAVGIQQILDFSESSKETSLSLINAANNAGGHDNITSIIIDINEIGPVLSSKLGNKLFKRSLFKGLIVFLVLALIGAGIFFSDKKTNYIGWIKRNLLLIIQKDSVQPDKIIIPDVLGTQTDTTSISRQNISDTTNNRELNKGTTNIVMSEDKMAPLLSSEQAKKSLQIAMDRINSIELKIIPVRPGESEYQPDYYNLHGKRLEGILHSLDSLKNRINIYAEIQDNNIVRLKVTNIEEFRILSLFHYIDNLNVVTENILSSQ